MVLFRAPLGGPLGTGSFLRGRRIDALSSWDIGLHNTVQIEQPQILSQMHLSTKIIA
jgi:hypothetical protein